MHGERYALEVKKSAEALRKDGVLAQAAEYSITLPPGQYAVFYSEPVSSKLQVQVYVYNGVVLYTTFSVLLSYPDLAEFQNSSVVPVEYLLTAATSPYGSNGGPYTPVRTITATQMTENPPGFLISIFTGEVDSGQQPVSQNVYMEIKGHP